MARDCLIGLVSALLICATATTLFAQQQGQQYGPPQRQYGPQQYTPQQQQQQFQAQGQNGQFQQGQPGGARVAQGAQGQPRPMPQAPFQLTPQQQDELDKVLAAWEQKSGNVSTLRVEFTLREFDPVFGPKDGTPKRVADGEIRYAAPDKGSYSVGKEEDAGFEHWVCDGQSIYEYAVAKKELIERRLPKELQNKEIVNGPMPFMFGASAAKLKQRYWMRITPVRHPAFKDKAIQIEAHPRYRQDMENFSWIEIMLAKETMMPIGLNMFMHNGVSRNSYSFGEPAINATLDRVAKGWFIKPSLPSGWKQRVEDVPVEAANPNFNPQQAQNPQGQRR